MQKNKVVIFDLDDTLYKEINFVKSGFHYIAKLVSNANALEEDVYLLLWETYQQGGNAFETVIKKFGFRLFNVQWMLNVYRCHKPTITLDDSVKETLEALKINGVTMAIITDGRTVTQGNKIEALGLKDYMNSIIINENIKQIKPNNYSFRKIEEQFECCDYYYVGDNVSKDFYAPNSMDWTTICLLDDGRNIHKQNFFFPKEYLPQYKIRTLRELKMCIGI